MNAFWNLARRSFWFHRRGNALFCAGCAVSAVVLVGALLTGASLRGSIRELFEPRLGDVNWVLTSSSGQFRESIADSVSWKLSIRAAPVLMMAGTVGIAGGDILVHRVNIIGIDDRFWELGPGTAGSTGTIGDNSAIVNYGLADKLKVNPGDQIIIRFQAAGALAMDAPFGTRENLSTLRLPVAAVVGSMEFGDFSLKAEHFTVYNVFVPLKLLQSANDIPGMANAVLISQSTDEQIINIIQKSVGLKDAGLNLRDVDGGIEIYSDRIFISGILKNTIVNAIPGAIPVSAWFVNSISASKSSTPYSFVSSPPLSHNITGDNIELTEWTARDLGAAVGDTVTLAYFVPSNAGRPEAAHAGLRVDSSALVISAIHGDTVRWINKSLMPPYPGLAGASGCTDWAPSIPVDLSKVRPKDEEYWDRYLGTPKAVISYEKASQIWANRFGVTTAIRIPRGVDACDIDSAVAASLTPRLCGMQLTDIRSSISGAVGGGTDFAPLFLGLSFFTFAASLILIWLLSEFQVRSRAEERKILAAVGYARCHILRIYLIEGMIVFSVGTVLGILLSPLYTLAVITALKTVWRAAAMTPVLNLHIEIWPLAAGGAAAFVCALAAMLTPIYSLTRGNRRGVLSTDTKISRPSTQKFDMRRFVLLNILRERRRAIGETAVLASALLILGTTQLFHQGAVVDPSLRSSGTGGFSYYGELNSGIPLEQTGVDFLRERGVDINAGGIKFLSAAMRVRDGDDASCLNINRASTPALLGADQTLLDSLGSFSFVSIIKDKGAYKKHPWKILGSDTGDENAVFGIADANTVEWGLGKSLGDRLTYINEAGDTLNVILAAALKSSVLQGKVVIAESDFIRHYPSVSGYRLLLLSAFGPAGGGRSDTAGHAGKVIVNTFESFHGRSGLQMESTVERLNAFNSVENTYLSIFAVLGMMGLALGCAGMGIIVMRGIEERRAELALLMVQGFRTRAVRRLLFSERAVIALTGTLAGLLPAVIISGAAVNWPNIVRIICLLTIVLSCGAGSIILGLCALKSQSLLKIIKDEA